MNWYLLGEEHLSRVPLRSKQLILTPVRASRRLRDRFGNMLLKRCKGRFVVDQRRLTLAEGTAFDIIDERVLWRKNYFWCGRSLVSFYNIYFVAAMEVIGKYCNPVGKNSDYHNGIVYIATQSGVSNAQVKAISKKMRHLGGYEFKTSRSFDKIMAEIIKALKDNEKRPEVQKLMYNYKYYRDMVAYSQCSSIRVAAKDSGDKVLRNIVIHLDGMLDTLSDDMTKALDTNG